MKLFLSLVLVLALGTGGYFLWKHAPAKESNNGSATRPTTALVEARDIRFAVNVAGEIAPAEFTVGN